VKEAEEGKRKGGEGRKRGDRVFFFSEDGKDR
jgi:hypothetical protein